MRFLSTPSARRATVYESCHCDTRRISIHALREEGDSWSSKPGVRPHVISIHALRKEGDPIFISPNAITLKDFYPRPPRGGRPDVIKGLLAMSDFYPRPPRGGRPGGAPEKPHSSVISIHALREEGDTVCRTSSPAAMTFLSTPSARRATSASARPAPTRTNFYPRPPRGGRREKLWE